MNQRILSLEAEMDSKFDSLKIWSLPFQTVLSTLLYFADILDDPKKDDDPFDFLSRLSYVFPKLKEKCKNLNLQESFSAMLEGNSEDCVKDFQFLNAYAHFSLIQPQVHREILITKYYENDSIELKFTSEEIIKFELIDRLYSHLACEVVIPFYYLDQLELFIKHEISTGLVDIESEIQWLTRLYNHYLLYQLSIKVLPDRVFTENFEFSHEELVRFCAAFRAFADFILSQAKVFKVLGNDESLPYEEQEYWMSLYMNSVAYQIKNKDIEQIIYISGLSDDTFYKIIGYYTTIISNTTGKDIANVSSCGEGYFPPLTLVSDVFITSPHAIRCLLTTNNILYSMNKTEKRKFDEVVSGELEPVLINQVERLFKEIPMLKTARNVHYQSGKGEIDLLILSETEKVCISIQAKATLAPDSTRSVSRVEGRVIEGVEQTSRFDDLEVNEKLDTINHAFESDLTEITLFHVIVVRSAAGSERAWKHNDKYKIVNYPFLAKVLAEKLESKNLNLMSLIDEINIAQQALVKNSNHSTREQVLVIDQTNIKFPIIEFDVKSVLMNNFRTLKVFPRFLEY